MNQWGNGKKPLKVDNKGTNEKKDNNKFQKDMKKIPQQRN